MRQPFAASAFALKTPAAVTLMRAYVGLGVRVG